MAIALLCGTAGRAGGSSKEIKVVDGDRTRRAVQVQAARGRRGGQRTRALCVSVRDLLYRGETRPSDPRRYQLTQPVRVFPDFCADSRRIIGLVNEALEKSVAVSLR